MSQQLSSRKGGESERFFGHHSSAFQLFSDFSRGLFRPTAHVDSPLMLDDGSRSCASAQQTCPDILLGASWW